MGQVSRGTVRRRALGSGGAMRRSEHLTLSVPAESTMSTMGLDIEEPAALLAYLRARRAIDSDEVPAVRVLTGGVSNRTVLIRRASGQAWVIKQALSKLRVEVDWFSSP